MVPTVHFSTEDHPPRPPFVSSSGGGTTRADATPIESPRATHAIRYSLLAAGLLLAGFVYSSVAVLLQEFEFRRELGEFRDQLIRLDAERAPLDEQDVVAALQSVAHRAGVTVYDDEVEIVTLRVRTRYVGGSTVCSPAQLPTEFERLNASDRHRFAATPMRCDRPRWIIGIRARVHANRLLRHAEFDIERYTWVDHYDPEPTEIVAFAEPPGT